MRLLHLREVDIGANDRVFRHSRLRLLMVWLLGCGVTAALFIVAYAHRWPPGYVFGVPLLLFVLLTRRMVTARFHAANWLVRLNETGLYVQYRSYLNEQLSADMTSVVFVSFSEITSARLVRERLETPDTTKPGATMTQYLRYVELELSEDTGPLAQALEAERSARAPVQKHWYGSGSSLYRDYPVTTPEPHLVRIRWDVVPGAHRFLRLLQPNTSIAVPVSLSEDYTGLKALSAENQQQRLRELILRGENVTAIYAARRLYGCSLTEAKKRIDALSAGQPPA